MIELPGIPRWPVWVATALGIAVGLFVAQFIGGGDYAAGVVYLTLFCLLLLLIVARDRAWLCVPLAMGIEFRVLPVGTTLFTTSEVIVSLVMLVFLARLALRAQRAALRPMEGAFVAAYAGWVALIFLLNPTGMLLFGTSGIGARAYLRIGIAFMAFLIVGNQTCSVRDARWLVRILVGCGIAALLVAYVEYDPNAPPPPVDSEVFYTWQQALSAPSYVIILWLVSRYRTRELWQWRRLPWLPVAAVCIALAAFSGKRAGFAVLLLLPPLAALVRREYRAATAYAVVLALGIGVLAFGQGRGIELPLTVQRSIAWLPGHWDAAVVDSTGNQFRQGLNDIAMTTVRESPWVGRMGYRMSQSEWFHELGGSGLTDLRGFAMIAAYHNTWLGIAADFGLPAAVIWALFWVQMLRLALWNVRHAPDGSPWHTLSLMILLLTLGTILRSWTSGSSGTAPFDNWWRYAALLAVRHGILAGERSPAPPSSAWPIWRFLPHRHPVGTDAVPNPDDETDGGRLP